MKKETWEPNYQSRRKIIEVVGGSKDHPDLTQSLGKLIAGMGYHLMTGAGGGIIAGASEAFFNCQERQGLVLGIIRADPDGVFSRLSDYAPNKVNK